MAKCWIGKIIDLINLAMCENLKSEQGGYIYYKVLPKGNMILYMIEIATKLLRHEQSCSHEQTPQCSINNITGNLYSIGRHNRLYLALSGYSRFSRFFDKGGGSHLVHSIPSSFSAILLLQPSGIEFVVSSTIDLDLISYRVLSEITEYDGYNLAGFPFEGDIRRGSSSSKTLIIVICH